MFVFLVVCFVGGAVEPFGAVQIGRIQQDDLRSAPRDAMTGMAALSLRCQIVSSQCGMTVLEDEPI